MTSAPLRGACLSHGTQSPILRMVTMETRDRKGGVQGKQERYQKRNKFGGEGKEGDSRRKIASFIWPQLHVAKSYKSTHT